jgi:hypothetical protein
MAKENKPSVEVGVGLDCGTMNFVSARKVGNKISTKRIRDAFLDLDQSNKRMLKISNTAFAEFDNKLIVIGDDALSTANLFNREARRPLAGGLISAGELDAQQVISLIMRETLGEPKVPNEKCCYSVPSPAVDVPGSDITYHAAILGRVLKELGYAPEPVNEALAIIYSECESSSFSGLGISYGSGMTNVCLAYNAMSALEFSVGRGGDWVDNGSAKAVGQTSAKICSIKESNIDIMSPKNREEEALSLFLQTLIDYTIDNIVKQFVRVKKELMVPKPIPIIVSGGTSLAGGFLDKFKERFETHRSKFPVEISDIRAAADPMTAVASGLLLLSQFED